MPFVFVDVVVKPLIITTYVCLAIFTPFDCVFYFIKVRKAFWITSLTQTPVCFPFHLFCSCASAFYFLTWFTQILKLRRFRGLMPYAEVTVRRKHVRLQHHAAVTQPLTWHWSLQWKWSLRTISGKNMFFKWTQKGTRSECLELLCSVKAAISKKFSCVVFEAGSVSVNLWLADEMTVCDHNWNGSKQLKHCYLSEMEHTLSRRRTGPNTDPCSAPVRRSKLRWSWMRFGGEAVTITNKNTWSTNLYAKLEQKNSSQSKTPKIHHSKL